MNRHEGNLFREQCNGAISCTVDCSIPLPMLSAWCGASAVYWIAPAFPVSSMIMKVADADASEYAVSQPAYYHPSRGLWRVYVPGWVFTRHCETFYKIVAENGDDERCVLGEGRLRVHGGRVNDVCDSEGAKRKTCYAAFPGGFHRRVLVSEDSTGSLSFQVSDYVIPSDKFERSPSKMYAYDRKTGFFHAVSGIIDSSGTPTLSVSEETVSCGEASFALDEETNLYYRIETDIDETGVSALITGDRK